MPRHGMRGDTARKAGNGSRLLQAAAILCQFAVTLLCRFAANRGSAYTDSILTEGLGLSLFVFFSCDLFLYLWMRKSGYLCRTLLWSFLLVSLRKQMMVTLLIMGIVFACRLKGIHELGTKVENFTLQKML